MNPTNAVAFIASLGVSCGVLYANPKRAINRSFFLASVNVAAWLLSLSWLIEPSNPNPVRWIRICSALGAFFPFLLWTIKDCAKGGDFGWISVRRGWVWFLFAICMAALCFSHFFIPLESTRENPMRGIGWSIYTFMNGAAYMVLFFQAIRELQTCQGIQKIEMQALLFGGASAGLMAVIMTTLGQVLKISALPRALPMVIVVFYSYTAWGITTQKVFDARDLFRSGFKTVISICVVSIFIWLALAADSDAVPRILVVIVVALLVTLFLNEFNRRVHRKSLLGDDHEEAQVRGAITAASRDEFEYGILVRRFSAILANWGRSDCAYFLVAEKDAYSCGSITLPMASAATAELIKGRWATPESLQRVRDASGRNALSAFMREYGLGVMICAPDDDGRAPFIIALKERRDHSPFKWSEVDLLQEWVRMIENVLSRVSLSRQARESEQLRTAGLLGASLAHEIRNPLVTLKTIAQSAKSRYNDPEFKRLLIELVPAEIERIEGLVSGLMDLGRPQHPHMEQVRLNEVAETSVKLVRPKALDEAVYLTCDLAANPDEIFADRASIRQVILNLVMNAIEAVSPLEKKREVTVRTRAGDGTVILEVSDNGPGMPHEVRRRLFQPFTTSNKTSGIGLGLAITADLVKLHHGRIELVDGGEVGTTFRVTLPCQQPSY